MSLFARAPTTYVRTYVHVITCAKKSGMEKEKDIVLAANKTAEAMGYTLKEKQLEVILNLVKGNDVFAVPPPSLSYARASTRVYVRTRDKRCAQ